MDFEKTYQRGQYKKPKKGFFLSLPSASAENTLTPIIRHLADSGYEILHYNSETFRPAIQHENIRFRAYPAYEGGYKMETLSENMSLFKFGEILIDTAAGLMDFLQEEVEEEKPDFILHTHLVLWGKLLAQKFQLPAIALFTTFVLDSSFMKSAVSKENQSTIFRPKYLLDAKRFSTKAQHLYDQIGLEGKINIWDVYANKEELNISFILEPFQPGSKLISPSNKHVGFPVQIDKSCLKQEHVYVSLGTIFNRNIDFFSLCIRVLSKFPLKSIISMGTRASSLKSAVIPAQIFLEEHVDQVEVLQKAKLFLTHGGMASVQEAVYTHTPMIVIPKIPEQIITAKRIQELGIGIYLPENELTESSLQAAINRILDNHDSYLLNLKKMLAESPNLPAADLATQLIGKHLNQVLPHYNYA